MRNDATELGGGKMKLTNPERALLEMIVAIETRDFAFSYSEFTVSYKALRSLAAKGLVEVSAQPTEAGVAAVGGRSK